MLYRDDPKKNKRLYTGCCKSPIAISIQLNDQVFDILIHEKLRKEREQLATFIYRNSLPAVHKNYTYNRVLSGVSYNFHLKTVYQNQMLVKEGGVQDKLIIVKDGEINISKKLLVKG